MLERAQNAKWAGLLLAAAYALSAWAGYCLRVRSGLPPMFWFSTGIGMAGLTFLGTEKWPWIALGSIVFDLARGTSFTALPVLALGHVLGPWLGAYWIKTRIHPKLNLAKLNLDGIREAVLFLGLAVFLAPAIGASVETLGFWIQQTLPFNGMIERWLDFALDEAVGVLMVVPAVIHLRDVRAGTEGENWLKRISERMWEFLIWIACLLFVSAVSYTPLKHYNSLTDLETLVGPYLLFPLMIWAALRFDALGALIQLYLTSACVIVGLLYGTMPLLVGKTPSDQIHFQENLFLVLGMTGLIVAAAIREKELALKFRDDFLSLASHELRTPLTALLLQTQTRKRRIQRQGPSALTLSQMNEWWTQDEKQISRLARLVDDIFDIARLNSEKFVLEKAPLELCAFVEEAVARLRPLIEERGCKLSIHRDEALQINGRWDASRLEQAIHNLLSNAGKYGAGKPVQVRIEKVGSSAFISIRDQGNGIRPEDRERIFKPYERAVDGNEISGLGLGLHIAKQIVDAHHGRIWVDSTLGEGSVFTMELPLNEA